MPEEKAYLWIEKMTFPKPKVINKDLEIRLLDELYKPNPQVGNSTADAIRYERLTGKPVNNRFHTKKGSERLKQIDGFLEKGTYPEDREILLKLKHDLEDALYSNI